MFYSDCVPQGSRGVLYRMSQGIRMDDSDYEASVLSTDDAQGSCIGLYRGGPQDSTAVMNRILQRWYAGFYMAGCPVCWGTEPTADEVYRVLKGCFQGSTGVFHTFPQGL